MTNPIQIGVVGLGKISRDHHLPSIEADPDFEFAFFADRQVQLDTNVASFSSLHAAINSGIPFDAVALCTSPQPRLDLYEMLVATRCAILLEKPAASSFEDAQLISTIAKAQKLCTMTAWHSQFSPNIAAAKTWVQTHKLLSGTIEWRENAKKWHPGQEWLWQKGGYGVFDPGMNALSILTKLTDCEWLPREPSLHIPENAETPVMANFALGNNEISIDVVFEFHDSSEDVWDIKLNAANGSQLILSRGGEDLEIDGKMVAAPLTSNSGEYPRIYRRFSELIRSKTSEIDLAPLEIIDSVFANARFSTSKSIEI